MLYLTDIASGRAVPVRPARRGVLRVAVYLDTASPSMTAADVRALLTADVLVRVAELGGLQALLATGGPARDDRYLAELSETAERLGIHPPAASVDSGEVAAVTSGWGPVDLEVAADGAGGPTGESPCLAVGPVDAPGLDADPASDPLAARLILLSHPCRQPLEVGAERLAEANSTLVRWRERVAAWAEAPSRPTVADAVQRAVEAARVDADTATAVRILHQIEDDPGVAPGAKFESFCYLDRILGLELPRMIGGVGVPGADGR